MVQCVPSLSQIKQMVKIIEAKEIQLQEEKDREEEEAKNHKSFKDDPYNYFGVSRGDFF